MRYTEKQFTDFLKKINLEEYRNKYSSIKIVEMDLPKNIQALDSIYQIYWDENIHVFKEPPLFEYFYKYYYDSLKNEIEEFWIKSGFGTECDCFTRGLEARIYRTWASLITQIHAGYVAENVFGVGTIEQSTVLDHKGIDILIHYQGKLIPVQIKKDTKRPEINRMHLGINAITQDGIYNIWYVVPKAAEYDNNPYYVQGDKKGKLRDSLKIFKKYNNEGTLDRLENGFVIFTTKEFELIKDSVDHIVNN